MKEGALTGEARGAGAVRKVNNISTRKVKTKNEGKKGKNEINKLQSSLKCFNCGREGHLSSGCNRCVFYFLTTTTIQHKPREMILKPLST